MRLVEVLLLLSLSRKIPKTWFLNRRQLRVTLPLQRHEATRIT